ncbi:uncharacterized protein F5147DRAFT_653379 [Suillus discolor]|uniref:Uncharacterized protein n=1 Tax=Suillus discolor TaxID=1912936 RepID=A0A9P7JTA8_9AGAM|nr:uncharacterized protein F5147DRAFT_653379 [Suillus discolor]KAG2107137.1 hypothetical protein F5147DRAFT_653379 [Suillus discolor]
MSFFEDIGRNNAQLSHLRKALAQLPHSIPLGNSKYNFEHYAPDPERVELYGSTEAALNNVLEVTFAPRGRKDESAFFNSCQKPLEGGVFHGALVCLGLDSKTGINIHRHHVDFGDMKR